MRHFPSIDNAKALSGAVAISLFVGCSSGSAIAPKPASPLSGAPVGQLKSETLTGGHLVSYDSCPATGPIKYVSNEGHDAITVFAGKFAGQSPCGQIAPTALQYPYLLFVKQSTHDLYVANSLGHNVLVFHRGQTTPYNTYVDPSNQNPVDVTVAKDGTVIASNEYNVDDNEPGSLSTWIGGPNGGTFVGNFPMTNSHLGLYVTSRDDGTVYFNDIDATTHAGVLWTVSCPSGACGPQTQVAGVSFKSPGGLVFDATDDLIAVDTNIPNQSARVETFELPNSHPTTFSLPSNSNPYGVAINRLDHHLFIGDSEQRIAAEYLYPSFKLVGTVQGVQGDLVIGVAVDP